MSEVGTLIIGVLAVIPLVAAIFVPFAPAVVAYRSGYPPRQLWRVLLQAFIPTRLPIAYAMLYQTLANKHICKLDEEQRAQLNEYEKNQDDATELERFVFGGYLSGLPLFTRLFLLLGLVTPLLPLLSASSHGHSYPIWGMFWVLAMTVLLWPPILRAGYVSCIPFREQLTRVLIVGNPLMVILTKYIIANLLVILEFIVGMFAAPFFAARLAVKNDRFLVELKSAFSQLN